MTQKFHRRALEIPQDSTDKKRMIRWLLNHPMFDKGYSSHFYTATSFRFVYVNPATYSVDDNDELNTESQVWLETGPWFDQSSDPKIPMPLGGWSSKNNKWIATHDTKLDCGGATLEEALLELAIKVMFFYGETNNGDDLTPVMPCSTECEEDNITHYCKHCGYAMSENK